MVRKASTENRARQVCFEYLPFANNPAIDPRTTVLNYLRSCKERGNDSHTLENKRIRRQAFYKTLGIDLKIPKFKFTVRSPEAYKKDVLDVLLADPTNGILWRTLLQAGLRKQEAQHLEHGDLLDAGMILVQPHGKWEPKDYECRRIEVPKSLIQTLRALPKHPSSNLVFPTSRGNVDKHMLRTLKRFAKRVGLDPVACWLHKFRASYAPALPPVCGSVAIDHSAAAATPPQPSKFAKDKARVAACDLFASLGRIF